VLPASASFVGAVNLDSTPCHACPCCGYRTLEEPAGGSLQFCPVCCWQDVEVGDEWMSETTSSDLDEAQRNFKALSACDPEWVDTARAPQPGEERDPDWLPIEAWMTRQRAVVLQAIDSAFGQLRIGRGMRVYEAEMADNYGLETELTEKVKHLSYQRYDEVPDDVIDQFSWVLSFFDAPGLRFHLAAYMAWGVRNEQQSHDETVYALNPGEGRTREWSIERLSIFDRAQAEAVVLFLEFMVRYEPKAGREALKFWRE
jgi:hypothetical protein